MSKEQALIEQEIEAELGQRQTAGLKANASRRICGLLTRKNADWDKAFAHISLHFHPITDPSVKNSHTVFHKRYRDKESLRLLLLRAAGAPSSVRLTKLKINNEHIGRPAVEIVRNFGELIGDEPSLTALRMFTDFHGELITAYPGKGPEKG